LGKEFSIYRSITKTYIDTNEMMPIKNIRVNSLPAGFLKEVLPITSIIRMIANNFKQKIRKPKYKNDIEGTDANAMPARMIGIKIFRFIALIMISFVA